MGFGHYTAFGLNYLTNKWYDFDDSSVSVVDSDSIITNAAYNLFYIRKDFYPEGKINFAEIANKVNETEFIALMN